MIVRYWVSIFSISKYLAAGPLQAKLDLGTGLQDFKSIYFKQMSWHKVLVTSCEIGLSEQAMEHIW